MKKGESLIKVKELTKTYVMGEGNETHALKGVTFEIKAGEFVAIMGHSGSGKSTLMHIIGFLDHPTSGQYWFKGKRMEDFSEDRLAEIRNEEIGFVFQSFNLLPRTSALRNVMLPLVYAKVPEGEQVKKGKQALEKVGLGDRMEHAPNELSGGQQQRVAIARALINNPSIVFADEPTGNLDSKAGEEILAILAELHKKGHTVILVTHEREIAEFAERMLFLKDGELTSDKALPVSSRRTVVRRKADI